PELRGQAARIRRLATITALGGGVGAALLLITPPQTFERVAPVLIGAASLALLVRPGQGRDSRRREPSPGPEGAKPDPVGARPDPVGARPDPVGARPDPVGARPDPVGARPDPVSARSDPVSAGPGRGGAPPGGRLSGPGGGGKPGAGHARR